VDHEDYAVWSANFSTTIELGPNQIGTVTAADYVLWRNNLGRTLFGVDSAASGYLVSEPATTVLLLLGLYPLPRLH
jgi:hypothetical protein